MCYSVHLLYDERQSNLTVRSIIRCKDKNMIHFTERVF